MAAKSQIYYLCGIGIIVSKVCKVSRVTIITLSKPLNSQLTHTAWAKAENYQHLAKPRENIFSKSSTFKTRPGSLPWSAADQSPFQYLAPNDPAPLDSVS